MKIRKINSFNEKYLQSKHLTSICDTNHSSTTNVLPKKEEILFAHKTSLEIMLAIIKKSQIDYLQTKNDNTINTNNAKNILFELKTNLSEILNEQEKIASMLSNQKNGQTKKLTDLIFNTSYSKRSISNLTDLNSNYETLITESVENDLGNETSQLKLLNFKTENEIEKLNFLCYRSTFLLRYLKTPHLLCEHVNEYILDNKKDDSLCDNELHNSCIQKRNKFMEVAKMKGLQDNRIFSLKFQVEKLKLILNEHKKNLEKGGIAQEIIMEEGKSYIETVEDINKNEKNDRQIEEDLKDEFENNKLDINDFGKILKLNVNNMNINVNINLNKQYINKQLNSDSCGIKDIKIQTDKENNNLNCENKIDSE